MAADLRVGVSIGARVGSSYDRTFSHSTRRLNKLGDAFKKTNQQLAAARGLIKYKRKLDEVKAHHAKVGSSADKMLADAKRAYAGAEKAAGQYGIKVGNVIDRQKKLRTELRRTEDRFATQRRRMERRDRAGGFVRSMRARALGVAGGAYVAGRMMGEAMEREEQRMYLRTVFTGPDRDAAVERAQARAREFSRQSLASDEEMLNIQYALGSAGFDEAAIDAAEEGIHKLAKVTRGEAGQVGEIVATTFNNMGEGMVGTVEEKMRRIGNVYAKTQFKYQIADFGQLGGGLSEATAEAIKMNVSVEGVAASLGLLNSAGLQGTKAGTAFAAGMRKMTAASEEFGFNIARTKDGALDLGATMQNFEAALRSDDVRMRLEEMVDEASGRISETDALAQLLTDTVGEEAGKFYAPLLKKAADLEADIRELREAGRSNLVNDEYGRFLEGGAAQWQMLGQNVRQVGEIFANSLLPQITAATGWLARQAGRVSELIERFPWVGRLVGALALGFGLLTVGAMALAGAVWVVNAAMLANPVGLVVAGFVAAGAIIYALWDPISEAVGRLWEKFEKLWEWIKKVGDAIKNSPIGKWFRRQFGDEGADDEPTTASVAPARHPGRGYARAKVGSTPAPGDALASTAAPRGPAHARARIGRKVAAGIVAAPLVAASPGAAPATDFEALTEQANRIGQSFEAGRVGASAPEEEAKTKVDLDTLRADVRELTDRFDLSRAPAAPAPLSREEEAPPLAGAAQPAKTGGAVFNQTFTFHFYGSDSSENNEEIELRMKEIIRRSLDQQSEDDSGAGGFL